jgi:hypothetical protein
MDAMNVVEAWDRSARLRQPAWGEDSDWYQVLSVESGSIARLEDFGTRDSALSAAGRV